MTTVSGTNALPIIPDQIQNVALIQPSRIGDIVFSLPTLSGLRQLFPAARISWLVDERCQELVEGHPDLDEIIVIPFKALEKALKEKKWLWIWQTLRELRKELRGRSFDLSVDLHGLGKSALLVLLTGARHRIGSANTNGMKELSGFFSKEVPAGPGDYHTVERNLALVRYLGGQVDHPEFKFKISSAHREEIAALLQQAGYPKGSPLIVIHPGAGWLSRRWPVECFAELIYNLKKDVPAQVAVIGGAEGGSKEEDLFRQLFSLTRVPVINLVHRLNLKQLLALLDQAALFIGNEAGPMHLAAALDKPVIAIIGPTRPELTGPFGPQARFVKKEVPCSPCRNRNCTDLKCMKSIKVSDVLETVRSVCKLY
jgi:heptosyltransferase I